MSLLQALIIAIVEGLTEFLPVSSTGHMVITSSLFGIEEDNFTKLFTVAIQLGAILAVVILYWKRFVNFGSWKFYSKLLLGVIPALVLGYLFNDAVEALLESTLTVAISLLLGGIVLLFIDDYFKSVSVDTDDKLTNRKAFIIGFWQVLAMIPGVSRSAASIIGAMQQGLTRYLAAEFSFFLAVPTMFAASGYSIFLKDWEDGGLKKKGYELITATDNNLYAFITGNVVAFIVALLAIRFFIGYLKKYGFKVFGYYRIVLGVILLIALAFEKIQ